MAADKDNKVVVLGIEFDVSKLVSESKEIQDEMDKIQTKQKELAAQGKKNSEEYVNNASQLRLLKKEYNENAKVIDNINVKRKAEQGSLKQQNAELVLAKNAYRNLSKEQRDNVEEGGKLQKQIEELNNSVRLNEVSIGDNHKAIGDYTSGLNALPGPLGDAAQGVDGLKVKFMQLLANPIVLLIAAVTLAVVGLYKAFTSTDSGALKFQQALEGTKAVLSTAKERLFDFGNGIIDLFSGDTEKAAREFGDALGYTSQSFGDAARAAADYAAALDDIEDTEKAYVARRAENANKIAKLEFAAADKSNTKEARIKSLDDAIAIERKEADEAVKMAKAKLDAEANLLAGKVGLNAEALKNFVRMTEEERKKLGVHMAEKYDKYHEEFEKLTELKAKEIEADTSFYETGKKLNAKSESLKIQLQDETTKAHEDAIKKREEAEKKAFDAKMKLLGDEKAALQVQVLESIKNSVGELNNKIALAEKERDIELTQKGLTANMKMLIEKQYQQNVLKLHQEYTKTQEDIAKKSIVDKLKLEDDRYTREKLLLVQDTLSKKQALDELHQQGLISEQEYINQLAQVDFDAAQKAKQQQIDDLNAKIELEQEGSNKRLEMENQVSQLSRDIKLDEERFKRKEDEKTNELNKKLTQARLQAAQSFFGNLASLFDQGSAEYKAFASLQIAASTAQGAMGAFAQASAIAPPPLGQILGIAAAGVVVAQGAMQLQKINELEHGGLAWRGRAARGMIIGGRPHSQGGTMFYGSDGSLFEAEKDELLAIVNKRSTGMLRNLSEWNQMGGGINFASGSSSYLADGGLAARAMSQPIESVMNQQSAITDAIMKMKPPVVSVERIATMIGRMIDVKARAQI